ncbi:MAG: hypothetical protein NZ750_13060 [Anaerolineae bacterium]|nr:hypothetical protein [Anaerolineae bacterium]MDW8173706.1 hypothetical protein [Anaerolineae bacterium]
MSRFAIGLALGLAALWWMFALSLRQLSAPLLIWEDQQVTFTRANPLDPYSVPGFVNPPWTSLLLLPTSLLRAALPVGGLELAVLAQWLIYAAALTLLALRERWPVAGLLVVMTSPLALDSALELNIEWVVALGLVLLPRWPLLSPLFMLSKPQVALGWLLGQQRGVWMSWLLGAVLLGLASVLLWGDWWVRWQAKSDEKLVAWMVNAAPSGTIGPLLATILGLGLALWAVRRHDSLMGLLAGLCFVPYVAFYSLMIPFTLLAARWPRLGLLISLTLWAVLLPLILAFPWAEAP